MTTKQYSINDCPFIIVPYKDYTLWKRHSENYTCGVCNGPLIIGWGGAYGIESWIVKCGSNYEHDVSAIGTTKIPSFFDEWKRNGGPSCYPAIQNKFEEISGRKGRRLKMKEEVTSAVIKVDEATRAMVTAHLSGYTKGEVLSQLETNRAFDLVQKGLDPYLHIMVYDGKVCTNIDGMYYWASTHNDFQRVTTRILIGDEKAAYDPIEGDVLVIASLFKKGEHEPAYTAIGRANASHPYRNNPVERNFPHRMAEKRAEAMVIRKAYPIGAQIAEDVQDYEENITLGGVAPADEEVLVAMDKDGMELPIEDEQEAIDIETGEILEESQEEKELPKVKSGTIKQLRHYLDESNPALIQRLRDVYKVDNLDDLSQENADELLEKCKKSAAEKKSRDSK